MQILPTVGSLLPEPWPDATLLIVTGSRHHEFVSLRRRALMSRNGFGQLNGHEVVDACRRAAWNLRSRPGSGPSSDRVRLDSAIGTLLEALGRALARDRESIPEHVQRAALQLARQIQVDRRGRTADAGHGHNGRYAVHPDTDWGAARGEAVPFTTSIRLGRMG
jgi:hypothetical protein